MLNSEQLCTVDQSEKTLTKSISSSDIERAIDQVLVDINIEIAKHVAHKKPKVIIVAGGFSRSPYLMKKLRERWTQGHSIDVVKDHDKADSALLAVSRGSLFRYDNISAQNLPSRYGYAILQDMEYDRKKHPDAETILRVWNEFTQTYWPQLGPNPDIVVTSERDDYTPIVRDRLKMVMRKGATAAGTYTSRLVFAAPSTNANTI